VPNWPLRRYFDKPKRRYSHSQWHHAVGKPADMISKISYLLEFALQRPVFELAPAQRAKLLNGSVASSWSRYTSFGSAFICGCQQRFLKSCVTVDRVDALKEYLFEQVEPSARLVGRPRPHPPQREMATMTIKPTVYTVDQTVLLFITATTPKQLVT
jgi:hypothetical protein